MEADIEYIKEEIINIKIILSKIDKELQIIRSQTEKMDNHIDFVDNVYDSVKKPFHFLCDKVSSMTPQETIENNV